jgi:hypothetical protein
MSKVEIDLEKAPDIASALSKLFSSVLNQPKESKKESA